MRVTLCMRSLGKMHRVRERLREVGGIGGGG